MELLLLNYALLFHRLVLKDIVRVSLGKLSPYLYWGLRKFVNNMSSIIEFSTCVHGTLVNGEVCQRIGSLSHQGHMARPQGTSLLAESNLIYLLLCTLNIWHFPYSPMIWKRLGTLLPESHNKHISRFPK